MRPNSSASPRFTYSRDKSDFARKVGDDGGSRFSARAMRRISDPTMELELSLIIPTYNERENIEETLRATIAALAGYPVEILVVDDDSPDRTWEVVERVAAVISGIRLVRRIGAPRDQAQAIMEGFRVSRGAIVGKMDADGSHDPGILPQLIAAIEAGAEVAIGSRYSTGGTISSWPLHRRILSQVSTAMVRALLDLKIKDPMSGFWILRRQVYERAAISSVSGYKVLLQLCVRGQAHRIAEVPFHFRDRTKGKTKVRPRVLLQALTGTISLAAANRRHSTRRGNADE